jgi:hypothetical protein
MTQLNLRAESAGPLTADDHDDNMLRVFGFADLQALRGNSTQGYDFYVAGESITTRFEGYRY